MKSKVLLISNMYPSNESPSYGVFIKDIYESFDTDDFEMSLCVIKKKHKCFFKKIAYYIFFNVSIFFKVLLFRPHYIYCHYVSHTLFLPVLLKLLGLRSKIIAHVHGSDIHTKNTQRVNYELSRCDVIVTPSNEYLDIIKKRLSINENGFPLLCVYPSGGVPDYFFSFEQHEKNKSIAYIGRNSNEKRTDRAIDFAKYLSDRERDYVFNIYGLKDKKNKEGNIIYHPKMKRNDLPMSLKKSSFLIVTSERESLCLAALEAMSLGMIVISNQCGGIDDYLVNGVNGYIVDMSSETWMDDVYNILNISELRYLEVSKEAKITAEKYKSSIVSSKFINTVFRGRLI